MASKQNRPREAVVMSVTGSISAAGARAERTAISLRAMATVLETEAKNLNDRAALLRRDATIVEHCSQTLDELWQEVE